MLMLMPVKVHKRWIQEVSPPTLYNHGFENMGSAGAVYSRVSSNIFGDWNACGKVACVSRDHLYCMCAFRAMVSACPVKFSGCTHRSWV